MTKKKLFKKGTAYLLSAAMALTGVSSISELGGVMTANAAESATTDLTNGLVAYYPFDGTLDNIVSTSGGEAKLHGGASSGDNDTWNKEAVGDVAYDEGKKGKAFSFNGGSAGVDGNNGLELDAMVTADSYTISFWVQIDNYTSASSLVFASSDNGGFNLAENWFGDTFPTLRVWKDGGWEESGAEDVYVDAWTAPEEGTWTYLTLTYTNGNLCLYRNGSVVEQKENVEHTLATIKNQVLFLGINWWDATIDGRIDDFALYNRALSADEVTALYAEENADVAGLELNITAEDDKTLLTNKKYSEDNIGVDSVQLSAGIVSQSLPMQCEWKVNDGANATVDDTGKVELTKDATDGEKITVTATNSYGVTGTIELTVEVVEAEFVEVESVTLNHETASIEVGDTLDLIATILPEDASEKDVIWTSDNASVATVSDNGIVTGVAKGTAIIEATSKGNDEISASCVVTVIEKDDSNLDEDNIVYTIHIADTVKETARAKYTDVSLSAVNVNRNDSVNLIVTPNEGYLINKLSITTEGSTCKINDSEKGANGSWIIKLSDFTADTVVNSITVETEEATVFENTDTDKNVGGASLGGTDFTDEEVTTAIITAITNKESIDAVFDESDNQLSDAEIDEVLNEIEAALNNDSGDSSQVTVSLVVNEENNLDASIKESADKLLETDVVKQAEATMVAGTEVKDSKIATTLDISLYASVSIKSDSSDRNIKIKLNDTDNKKMTIKMSVPSNVKKEEEDITRLYYVIHFHGEEQEIIPCKYDKTDNTITFESNKFSPFVLCYVDTAKKVSSSGLATYPVTITPATTPTATVAPTATPTAAPIATVAPTVTPTAEPTAVPTTAPVAEPTVAPTAVPTTTPSNADDNKESASASSVKVGDKVTIGNLQYEVTSTDETKTVVFTGVKKNNAKVVIPATVKISGDTYKVKGITKSALKGDKKLKKLTIGKNVKLIGKNAFNNCKNLKKIVIKSKKLTTEKVDNNAFKGINANVTIKVPNGKVKSYKKLIIAKGAGKKVKFI